MSLAQFQLAMMDLIASPERCLDARWDPVSALARYDLTARERRRVIDAVRQKGMATNCALYRSQRVTPIYTSLHLSCLALANRLETELDEYWRSGEFSDRRFRLEIERFAHFLKRRIEDGALAIACLPELLDFELASNDLRNLPRRRLLAETTGLASSVREVPARVHPLVRVARFSYDTRSLFAAIAHGDPCDTLSRQESFVVLSVQDDPSPQVLPVERELGALLWELQQSGVFRGSDAQFASLAQRGLIIPASPPPSPINRS
jgi:hypothetical protein